MAETKKTRTLGPGTLKIGDDAAALNFDADVTNVKIEPDGSGDATNFLDGHTEAEEMKWKLSGNIKEDYSATGVQAFCFKNNGKSLPFTFVPNNKAAMRVTGKVAVSAIAVGGDVKSKNDQSFDFAATDVEMDFTNNPQA